ncbi:MAG: hypothetical protein Q9170_003777 [Blastenia crenularia]
MDFRDCQRQPPPNTLHWVTLSGPVDTKIQGQRWPLLFQSYRQGDIKMYHKIVPLVFYLVLTRHTTAAPDSARGPERGIHERGIRKTATATVTIRQKRDLPATTAYPASRLSSACSCILTATPQPTTLYTSTKTITQTSTTSTVYPGCITPGPIVINGDFETGNLSPWEVLSAYPDLPGNADVFAHGVASPGYNSQYSYIMYDKNATSVGLIIGQTVYVCPGARYKLSAQIFITGDQSTGTFQDRYAELYVDDLLVAAADQTYIRPGPPFAWKSLSGEFYMNANYDTLVVKVRFLMGSSYVESKFGVDDVVLVRVV